MGLAFANSPNRAVSPSAGSVTACTRRSPPTKAPFHDAPLPPNISSRSPRERGALMPILNACNSSATAALMGRPDVSEEVIPVRVRQTIATSGSGELHHGYAYLFSCGHARFTGRLSVAQLKPSSVYEVHGCQLIGRPVQHLCPPDEKETLAKLTYCQAYSRLAP